MKKLNFKSAKVGDRLPNLIINSVSRKSLAIYSKASGDHNPIHINLDFAKQTGLNDVIAHGMLIMGYLGRVLTDNINQHNILEYGVRFLSVANIGDVLSCSGSVADIIKSDSQRKIRINLKVENQHNEKKITGYSIINIS